MSSPQGGPSGSTKISFGFRKTALPAQTSAANPLLASKSKPPAFSSFGGDDEDDEQQSNAAASSSSSSVISKPKKKSSNAPTGLAHSAPASRVSRQKAAEAEQLDSSVYDYDNVFDSLKSVQRSQAEARQAERAKRDPKYIEGMLDSVKERNKLLLRAQAKKIQREREAEGEEFQEGEEFVTDAYREQQEELRKVEEAERAEEEKQAKNKKGLSSFYKDMMASKEAEHEAAVAAAAAAAASSSSVEPVSTAGGPQTATADGPSGSLSEQDRQARLAKEASKRGLNAQLNDEGELVDQRSVLSAGLNVLGRDKKGSSREDARSSPFSSSSGRPYSSSGNGRGSARDGAAEARRLREEARERASRQVEEQILEVEAQREEERAKEEEQRKRTLIGERRNDESKVAEARRRMEERKLKKRKMEEEGAENAK